MKKILIWNKELNCFTDSAGNVWVMDHEPKWRVQKELDELKESIRTAKETGKVEA